MAPCSRLLFKPFGSLLTLLSNKNVIVTSIKFQLFNLSNTFHLLYAVCICSNVNIKVFLSLSHTPRHATPLHYTTLHHNPPGSPGSRAPRVVSPADQSGRARPPLFVIHDHVVVSLQLVQRLTHLTCPAHHIPQLLTRSDTDRHGQTRSDTVRHGQTRSDAVRRGQTRSDAARRGQTRSDAVRRGQTRSDTIRHCQTRSDTVRRGQTRSDAV